MNTENRIELDNTEQAMNVFGHFDENIRMIEDAFGVTVLLRDSEIRISGEEEKVGLALGVLRKMQSMASTGEILTKQVVGYLLDLADEGNIDTAGVRELDYICINARGRKIKPKTQGQNTYIEAIKKNDIVFGIGPAGTGKTFLAVVMAVNAYRSKQVNRIVLTRPAVEAGEKLGFLPGDMQNKVDPYLRPLYDALYDMMGAEAYLKHMEKGVIEVVPLAYMRGRTLEDAFIILDEAQNTTPEQMKMFLTRMGLGSKVVITGDVTQVDLPRDKKSGLKEAQKILSNIAGISFVTLSDKDVVRHELVKKIIKAYDRHEHHKEESDLSY